MSGREEAELAVAALEAILETLRPIATEHQLTLGELAAELRNPTPGSRVPAAAINRDLAAFVQAVDLDLPALLGRR